MNYRLQNYIFSCMLCILHNLKMMVNVMVTLQPMAEYSTLHHIFFSTIPLPPLVSICVHSSTPPSPLLLYVIFQSHFLKSCFYEF